MIAEFTKFEEDTNWCDGKVGEEYEFQAKLFDEGSHFGIGHGKVSKLEIRQNGVPIVSYDRGWSQKPSNQVRPAYDAIMHLLENAPKRFDK